MSGVTLVSANPSLEARLEPIYDRGTTRRRVWSDRWRSPASAVDEICGADPDVVIFGSDVAPSDTRELLPELERRFPDVAPLVLTLGQDRDEVVELLRLGARDVIAEDSEADDLKASVEHLLEIVGHRRSTSRAGRMTRRRVIAVLSPKGGSGKTTMATNLAVGLALRAPQQVLLIDLDSQFGDCLAALGIAAPEHDLAHAVSAVAVDRSALKVFLTTHESGLAILPPPDDLAVAEEMDPDALKSTIGALVEEFPLTVIDTSAGIDEAALIAAEFATDLLFVSTTDVPSIRAVAKQLDALDRIGLTAPRRHFLLNRSNARVGLSISDVETSVGMEAAFTVPSSRAFPIATNEGIPLIQKSTGGPNRQLNELVEAFAPPAERSSGRWFKRKA